MKRLKLCDRLLPKYTLSEELVNAISHGIGALFGIAVLLLGIFKSLQSQSAASMVGSIIYGVCMIILYTISTVYHALVPGTAKKVMQILDHCSIYILIAGTYTPILLSGFVPHSPHIGWGLLGLQWGVAILAIVLNAIDLKKYSIFSYTAYIVMGWSIIFFTPQAMALVDHRALLYILLGGISYTVGAILYAIGSRRSWFHSVFHFFVLAGSFLQFLGIYLYIL